MSVRAWTNTTARPTPWYAYLIALLVATTGGLCASFPKFALVTVVVGPVVYLLYRVIARPITGVYLTLAFFPLYPFLRGVCRLHEVPLPYAVLGMWPEMLLALMLVSLIVTCCRTGKRLMMDSSDIPPAIMVAGGLYGILLSVMEDQPVAAFYGAHNFLTPLLFYFVIRWLRPSEQEERRLLWSWLFPFFIMGVVSFYDYIYHPNYFIEVAMVVREGFWGIYEPHWFFRWYPRMASLLYWELNWGTLCVILLLFSYYRFPFASWRQRLLVYLPLMTLTFLGFVFSMSRGAMLFLAAAVLTSLLVPGRHRKYTIGGGVLLLLGFLVLSQVPILNQRVTVLTTRVGAFGDSKTELHQTRQVMAEASWKAFQLLPAGRGLGRAGANVVTHGTGDGQGAVTDGGYFKVMAEQGLPGMVLLLVAALWQIYVFYRARHQTVEEKGTWALLALTCYLGMLLENIGANIFDSYYITPVFWMIGAMAINRIGAPKAEKRAASRLALPN